MKFKHRFGWITGGLGLVLTLGAGIPVAHANVYATNIRLNGGITNVPFANGNTLAITYILNDYAPLGVTVNILAGTNVVRSIALPGNTQVQGLNEVDWDGLDNHSNFVGSGIYSISITAAADGYLDWTQISQDSDTNFVYDAHGIAVNCNPLSPYYGRIYVVNSVGTSPADKFGDLVGVLMLNGDTSGSDDGIYSDGGVNWAGSNQIPYKVAVAADDSVYVSALKAGGPVYRWDPLVSPGSKTNALRGDNVSNGFFLTGLSATGSGTNTYLWGSGGTNQGVVRFSKWKLRNNGVAATNDLGTAIVQLPYAPTNDIDVDQVGNLFIAAGTNAYRFGAYDPSTNGGLPETSANASWIVSSTGTNFGKASGIAVDPTGTYVAVSYAEGNFFFTSYTGTNTGPTRIFYATNGALAADLDLGVANGPFSDLIHQDTACAWDAVGNVYYIDNWQGYCRVFSPPGPNEATTIAAPVVEVFPLPPPRITSISLAGSTVIIIFTGVPGDPPGLYTVVSAPQAAGTYTPASGVSIISLGHGVFQATVPVNFGTDPRRFYRIRK
jgi:hypothetical protein